MFLVVAPIAERLTGAPQDVSEFAGLEGDLPMLLVLVALSWTLAALVEELAFRGYLLTRITDLVGTSLAARAAAVVAVALLFASIHGEQGATGMVLVFVDAVFYGVLRYRYHSALGVGRRSRRQQHRRHGRVLPRGPVHRAVVTRPPPRARRNNNYSNGIRMPDTRLRCRPHLARPSPRRRPPILGHNRHRRTRWTVPTPAHRPEGPP